MYGVVPECPPCVPLEMFEHVFKCFHLDPKKRISMDELISAIKVTSNNLPGNKVLATFFSHNQSMHTNP